jgi:RNA ligase
MIHPARRIPYHQIVEGLREAQAAKLVYERRMGDHSLWVYSQSCVYERGWNEITIMARGLILDTKRECVVATPFPKFFNLGERGDEPTPNLPFEVFEKLDGSLIILWHDGETWRTATKGSLDSDQARAARAWVAGRDISALRPGTTYLAEYCAPTNRIVVPYEREELVLLGAYDEDGYEPAYPAMQVTADQLGWRLAERHEFGSLADLVAHAGSLPATAEGFVLRFTDGTRLKVKGDEYRRIHALISRCTPLAMWEAMQAGDNMLDIRDQLPDEFLGDFDAITATLGNRLAKIVADVAFEAGAVVGLSDKEVGLRLKKWPDPIRTFIFPFRKTGTLLEGRARQALFRAIRPTGNVLEGYTPSYAMNRVMEEAIG